MKAKRWYLVPAVLAALVLAAVLVIWFFCASRVLVEVQSAQSWPLEEYPGFRLRGQLPVEILAFRAKHDGPLWVTVLVVSVDNQSRYTYEWDGITIHDPAAMVYFDETVSMKNSIPRGEKLCQVMIVGETPYTGISSMETAAQLRLVFRRPLVLFSRSLTVWKTAADP